MIETRYSRIGTTLLALSIVLCAPATVAAQERSALGGSVTTEQGAPLDEVDVRIPALDRNTTTDADGAFRLAQLPAGTYTVEFRRTGYASEAREINLPATSALDVSLRIAPFPVEPITVSVAARPIEVARSPLPTTIVDREQLHRGHRISLAHSLRNVAGVRALTTGGEIGKPVIRGLSGSRLLVLEGGMRLEDYSWSNEDGPSIDAQLADRVEIIRGPASVLYGSDAIGGIINVIPKPLPDAFGGEGFTRGGVEAYGASNNREVGTILRIEGASGAIGWRAVAIGRFAEALHTPAGELENTGFGALNGSAGLAYRGDFGTLTARYSRYGGEFKLLEANGPPPGEEEGEEEEEGPERKLTDDRVQLRGTFPVGGIELEARGQWQRHWLAELADEFIPGQDPHAPRTETTQFDLVLNTELLEVLAHHSLSPNVHGTVGVSGSHQSNDSRGPIPLVPDTRVNTEALFALEQASLGKVTLLAGARVDLRQLDSDPDPRLQHTGSELSYTNATWNLGAVLQATPMLSFNANLGSAWRAPNMFELFTNGLLLSDARYEIGDPDLDSERSINIDAGARWDGPVLHASVSAFRNGIDNFIYLSPTDDMLDGFRVYRYLQADATLTGAEISARVDPLPVLALRVRYDFVRGDNDEIDEPLPLMPPPRINLEAELHSNRLGWADRGYLSAETEYVAEQDRLSSFDTPTGDHTLLNLGAGIVEHWVGHLLRFDLSVRNATNASYRSFLSRYKEFALDPGRSIVARISADF